MPAPNLPEDHQGRPIDFGRAAADYEDHRPGFPETFFDRLAENRWIEPGQRVLDLGTGTGSLALGFARRGTDVTGLDLSNDLLDVAARRATAAGLVVQFVTGRAERTGLPDAAYDLVTAGQCWWWFNAAEALHEIRRVLVPGGRLVIGSFSYLPLPGNVAARTEDLVLKHNPDWPKAGWHGIHPEQVEALDRGGFGDIESFSYDVTVPFTHEGWRGRVRTCNGVGAAMSAEAVERFDGELAGVLAAEFPSTLRVPHRVFAVSGVAA